MSNTTKIAGCMRTRTRPLLKPQESTGKLGTKFNIPCYELCLETCAEYSILRLIETKKLFEKPLYTCVLT